MKRRWKLGPLFVGGLVVAAIAFVALRPSEPIYAGKRLSEWLDQYEASLLARDQTTEQARSAIRHIGTNALPVLLRMVGAKDSALKQKLLTLAEE